MCRFLAYLGPPILADELLLKPEHSLIRQSYEAREMSEPLNGDGFGIGWYRFEVRQEPGLFKDVTPAWNNLNLRHNAAMIQTPCLFAHIRAATEGVVNQGNCHPFAYKQHLMMHNGGVHDFPKIKRMVHQRLDDDLFLWIKGQTDTEHLFALLMQILREQGDPEDDMEHYLFGGFADLFEEVEQMKRTAGITGPSIYNMAVTDGHRLVATRYSSDPGKDQRTLYYDIASRFYTEGGNCKTEPITGGKPKAILIVSEKLDEDYHQWREVPENHAIIVDPEGEISLRAF